MHTLKRNENEALLRSSVNELYKEAKLIVLSICYIFNAGRKFNLLLLFIFSLHLQNFYSL